MTTVVADAGVGALRAGFLGAGVRTPFDAFVAHAYAAMVGEAPGGLPTFRDGLRGAVLTDAVLVSAASGEWIEVGQ